MSSCLFIQLQDFRIQDLREVYVGYYRVEDGGLIGITPIVNIMLSILTTQTVELCWNVRGFIAKHGFHSGWGHLVEVVENDDDLLEMITSETQDIDLNEIKSSFFTDHNKS